MTNEPRQLDPVEDALVDLDAAAGAGVFRRTPVDGRNLLRPSPLSGWVQKRRVAVRFVSVAAVLALAVGVWGWMFSSELDQLRRNKASLAGAPGVTQPAEKTFTECMDGPSDVALELACQSHDHNDDGRIDLRDYSAVQLAYAAPLP